MTPYPSIDDFWDLLTGLLRRPDVEAVYVLLDELDFKTVVGVKVFSRLNRR